jgi:hypothetical protein
MNTTTATDDFQKALSLFGGISNNLVYITEELPSLALPKETEERIVSFSTTFLECLVESDKNIRQLMTVLSSVPSRVPENAGHVVETIRGKLSNNVQAMHALVMDLRSYSPERHDLTHLSVLLNESGANILRDFVGIQEILGSILKEWKQ